MVVQEMSSRSLEILEKRHAAGQAKSILPELGTWPHQGEGEFQLGSWVCFT